MTSHANSSVNPRSIAIGVLIRRGHADTLRTWQPTADYLSAEIPDYQFSIEPLDFDTITTAVAADQVEFIITNSGMYVEFEALYAANRIATLKTLRMGRAYTVFGGVILCHADRSDLQSLMDLRGKRVMAVAENSLGGWRMAWREIQAAGINPHRDFDSLQFGGSHDRVVHALQRHQVDVGIVATHLLEMMAAEGTLSLDEFKIINPQLQHGDLFPFVLSTRLYPEYPFAVARQTSPELAEQVAIALLKLSPDHPAAIAAKSAGWTIPLNYQPIHECFQELQVSPYKDFGRVTSSFQLAVKGSNDGLWDWNLETNEVFFSDRWKTMLGYEPDQIPNHLEQWMQRLHPDDHDRVSATFRAYFAGEIPLCEMEYRLQHHDQSYRWVLCRGTLLRDVRGKPYRFAGSHTDITKRKQAEEELRLSEARSQHHADHLQQALQTLQATQLQLVHSEKMSSLGQLVAGLAHEINNPVNFIYANVSYVGQYVEDLLQLVRSFQQHYPDPIAPVQAIIDAIDLDFLTTDLPDVLTSMKVGADRIRQIVLSLRNFSRLDEAELKPADIHDGINSTLLMVQHRLLATAQRPAIQVNKAFAPLPLVDCYPGQLNQVFMNIISNAIDALDEAWGGSQTQLTPAQLTSPQLTIRTELLSADEVCIWIADNGVGMDEATQQQIFNPFFTTKPVGKSTGLGLAISYQIVVSQHAGRLECHSQLGQGSKFCITIPLKRLRKG